MRKMKWIVYMTGVAAAGAVGLGIANAARPTQPKEVESKGYVISLFVPAMNSTDHDCPEGKNPNAVGILKNILEAEGKSKSEIEKITAPDVFNGRVFAQYATMRGRFHGKPVNVYHNPLSVPDPKIKLASMKEAYGFNLDGRADKDDFTDPLTGEKGVDNAAVRVFGCFDRTRGTLESPPTNWSVRWRYYSYGNTWLIDVKGLDDVKNDEDVEVTFYRGIEPATRYGSEVEDYQRFMTYTVDPDPRLQGNTFKGKVKDGMFISEAPINFYMIASTRLQPEFRFAQARLRLSFKPDGNLEGFIGGFLPITMVYFPFGNYASAAAFNGGMNIPGVYYALRQQADSDLEKDPKTGDRTRISQTYLVRAVPAFLRRSNAKVASADPNS